MNHKNQLMFAGLLSSAILFAPGVSYAGTSEFKLTPYGGVDFGMQNVGFKAGYGDNVFKKHLPKGNLFAGVKFNDYVGLEGGYETTLQGKRDVRLNHPYSYLGFNSIAGEWLKIHSKTKMSGFHLGVTGDYPFFSNSLSLIGYVGIKKTRLKLISNIYQDANVPSQSAIDELNQNNTKTLFRLSAGLQYFLNEHFGVRVLGSWENTSRFQPTDKDVMFRAKLKNSVNYSVGFVFK